MSSLWSLNWQRYNNANTHTHSIMPLVPLFFLSPWLKHRSPPVGFTILLLYMFFLLFITNSRRAPIHKLYFRVCLCVHLCLWVCTQKVIVVALCVCICLSQIVVYKCKVYVTNVWCWDLHTFSVCITVYKSCSFICVGVSVCLRVCVCAFWKNWKLERWPKKVVKKIHDGSQTR